jgi:hypothetical protein
MASFDQSMDNFSARNSTKIYLEIQPEGQKSERVGRVQSMDESRTNNFQVLTELGRDYAVELKKGITTFTFTLARFYVRSDVIDELKTGMPFSLWVKDGTNLNANGTGASEILQYFEHCAITALSRSITNGQVTVAENATVAIIGPGTTGAPAASAET